MSYNPLVWLTEGGVFSWVNLVVCLLAVGWAVLRTRRRSVYRWADVAMAFMLCVYACGLAGAQLGVVMTFSAVAKTAPADKQALLEQGLFISTYPLLVGALGMLVFVGVLVALQVLSPPESSDRKGFGWVALGAGSHALIAGAITVAALPFWGFLATMQIEAATESLGLGTITSLCAVFWPPVYGVGRVVAGFVTGRSSEEAE